MTRRRLLPWVSRVLVVVSAVYAVLRLSELASDGARPIVTSAAYEFWIVAVVIAASANVRGRSTFQVFGSALAGFFGAAGLAILIGRWVGTAMEPLSGWRYALVAPMTEEIVKALPLVVLAAIAALRRGKPGLVDFTVAGMAVGAGFAVHEDAIWGRVTAAGFADPIGWLLPSVHTATGLVAGHVVWTGVVGFAIGWWVTRGWRIGAPLTVVALAVAVFDHGSWNHPQLRDGWRWIVADGWLPIVMLLLAVAAALALDFRALRRGIATKRPTTRSFLHFVTRSDYANPVRRYFGGRALMRGAARYSHGRLRRVRAAAEVQA